jgi:hypothetical protein
VAVGEACGIGEAMAKVTKRPIAKSPRQSILILEYVIIIPRS